jgi:sugar transferase (PEP-CTERM/EpsH1 system associated)
VRVLYICHRIPFPPNKGDKIRAFHQLRALAEHHEVDLFTLADEDGDSAHAPALKEYCRRVTVCRLNRSWARLRAIPFLVTRKPLTLPYFYSRELDREIRQASLERSYDRIFVYCSAMAQYVETVDQTPVFLDLVDVDSDKWRQYAAFTKFPFSAVYRREARCLREYERRVCERSSGVFVTTEREAQLVRNLSDSARVHVIPNGVDTEYFDPIIVRTEVPPEPPGPVVIFTGDMSYFPNEEAVIFFARKVFAEIRRTVADARFLIVGRNPGRNVQQLRKIEGVEVTGFVPDVRAYLAKARVSVAPFTIAAGIQNKILEAMAYGLPVVATSRAVQGLSKGVAEIVETGNSAEELAAKTVRILRDPEFARRRGMEGRSRVAADYNWQRSLDGLLRILEDGAGMGTRNELYARIS